MKILLTGGAGFIGSHLAELHLKRQDEVVIVDNLSTGKLSNISHLKKYPGFKFYQSDILNWQELSHYVKWADRIYHLAAIVGVFQVLAKPIDVLRINIAGSERLLDEMTKIKNPPPVVLISSSSVYGNSQRTVLNEHDDLIIKNATFSLSTYCLSKLALEELGWAYHRVKGIPTIMVRLFNVIGKHQSPMYGSVVPRFINQACHGKPITVFGDGTQGRSFSDVHDVVRALDLLGSTEQAIGEIFNVGSNHEITIQRLAEFIKTQAQSPSEIVHIPYHEAYGEKYHDVHQRRPDLAKLFKLTDYQPQWKLEDTLTYLIKHQKEKLSLKEMD